MHIPRANGLAHAVVHLCVLAVYKLSEQALGVLDGHLTVPLAMQQQDWQLGLMQDVHGGVEDL
ncbi:MAG: hypothetical protein EOO63_00255 [Hymenobacter sp.]|nr:MAG: hypothetical protein EOO63_00255 [Hymenobacter sp.]